MADDLSRRAFLRHGATAALLLAGSAEARPRGQQKRHRRLERPDKPRRVVILGAGLAGLCAAYELGRAGHEVTVLEARLRPGGRVLTLRSPFSDGLHADAGARFVLDNNDLVLHYLDAFGLALDDATVPGRSVYHFRGRRLVPAAAGAAVDWGVDLGPDGVAVPSLGAFRQSSGHGSPLERRFIDPVLPEIEHPDSIAWDDALAPYDALTFSELAAQRGATPDALAVLKMELFLAETHGDGMDHISAADALRGLKLIRASRDAYTVRGGADTLPRAFAARLAEKIHYGAEVVRIEHRAGGVEIAFRQAGELRRIKADRAICTLPFSVLRDVERAPRFSPAKERAVEELLYTSVTRVYLQFHQRFWQEQGLSGTGRKDDPAMECNHVTANLPGPRGILESYMAGPSSRRLAARDEEGRIATTAEHVESLFPGARQYLEGGVSKCWDEDPWSRGAYRWVRPGQAESLLPHVAGAEGRVHFAGEHTSAWFGWMQGALESAWRAAREINEAV